MEKDHDENISDKNSGNHNENHNKNDNSTNTIDVAIRTVNENDVQIADTASHQSDFGISPTK